jgi:pimeloyl-ACP methyl ester carboxylesterase
MAKRLNSLRTDQAIVDVLFSCSMVPNSPGRSLAVLLVLSGGEYTLRARMKQYLEAWSSLAPTAMLNWYRALSRPLLSESCAHVPTLILWGLKDAALTHRMARPSVDYCEDGKLILFPDDTHWVQHEAADEVNRLLIEFFRT